MQIERVKVESLVFDPVNARKHSKRNIDAIKGSLAKFGQQKPLVVGADGVVIAGNGTLEAAKALGWEEVDVHRSPLKGAEAIAFALADNKTAELAEWDEEILKEHLSALYADGWDIEDIGFEADDLDLDRSGGGNGDEQKYVNKVQAPIYEPTGEKPEVNQLYDASKTKELLSEIKKCDLPKEIKQFLTAAAARHTVFDYENIAEFYAHSDEKTKALFEQSCLVIIDFEKAIENGFVKLSEALAEVYNDEIL